MGGQAGHEPWMQARWRGRMAERTKGCLTPPVPCSTCTFWPQPLQQAVNVQSRSVSMGHFRNCSSVAWWWSLLLLGGNVTLSFCLLNMGICNKNMRWHLPLAAANFYCGPWVPPTARASKARMYMGRGKEDSLGHSPGQFCSWGRLTFEQTLDKNKSRAEFKAGTFKVAYRS